MNKTIEVPVLVAGGGPVGTALAMDLALHGVKSLVLESRHEIPANPRCNTTNARTMEILRRLGCADAVRRAGLPASNNTDVVYMTTMNGEPILRYQRPTPEQWMAGAGAATGIGADWPTPEPQHFISQLYMEPVLRAHAVGSLGVDLRTGWELVSFEQDASGVTAVAREVSGEHSQTIRAQYLVGADGSNSLVRRQIGARLEGIPRLGDACTVFIKAPRLTELYRQTPGWMYRFIGGVVLVAINGVDEWLVHTHPPEGADLESFDFEPQMFAAIGEAFAYEVINVARWTARAMVVNKFREGRVFVAGDAAHLWIPMGGFGMNAGVGDAVSLSWRLAGVVQGWLHEKMLDSYEAERVPMGARVASQAARWGMELRPLMRPEEVQRDRLFVKAEAREALAQRLREVNTSEWQSVGMQLGYAYTYSPVIAYEGSEPPPFKLDAYQESSCPGARAPHLWRDRPGADGRPRALFDDFGRGYTLLRIGADAPAGGALIELARQREIPLAVVDVAEAEATGKYEGHGLVLVRPDMHIVWRSKAEPANAASVWDRVTGVLVPERAAAATLSLVPQPADIGVPHSLVRSGDSLLCSDATEGKVWRVAAGAGPQQRLFDGIVNARGVALMADGRVLVVSAGDACLHVAEAGFLVRHADLTSVAKGRLGHVAVRRQGGLYITDETGHICAVDAKGGVSVALTGLKQPAGLAITPDGNTLLIAEGGGAHILQSRIALDGTLGDARSYIDLARDGPAAGLAVDAQGQLWVCLPAAGAVHCYDGAGRLCARVQTPQGQPLSSAITANGELLVAGADRSHAGRSPRGWLGRLRLDDRLTSSANH